MQSSSSSLALLQKYFPEVERSYEARDDFFFTPFSVSAFSEAVLRSCRVEKSGDTFVAFSVLSKLRGVILDAGFLKIRNCRLSQEPNRLKSKSEPCLAREIEEGDQINDDDMISTKSNYKLFEDQIRGGAEEGSPVGKSSTWDDMPKFLLAGAVSTVVSRTCVAPLERIKLECILQGSRSLTWVKTIQWIWASEGLSGFWKGNLLNLFRMVPFKSINFLCYDMYCQYRLQYRSRRGTKEITSHDRLIGGGMSGIAATVICLPLDTIRTRLVAPGGEALGGVVGCFVNMVKNEGFLSLYKGLTPALISMGPASAVFYAVYDVLKASYLAGKLKRTRSYGEAEARVVLVQLEPTRTLVYGAIAGAVAETVTYPLEVMRRQLQLQQARRLGLVAAFAKLIQTEGVGSLFAGLVPSTLQVLPSAALSYLFYETMKSILKINS